MKKSRVTKQNSKKQKEAVRKFKKVKAKPKKKPIKRKMKTYKIAVRKNRTQRWVITSDYVTASSKVLATHIAAHRNPNRWVRVLA